MSEQGKLLAVVSDLVGVCVTDGTHLFISELHRRYGITPSALEFFRQQRRAATTSGEPIETVLEKCQQEWGTTYDTQELARLWLSSYNPIDTMLDLYKRLRSAGFRLALITNNVLGIVEYIDDVVAQKYVNDGFSSFFDAVVASYVRGVRKPQKQIYQEACDSLGITLSGAVFLDDKQDNLPSAKELGMTTLLHINPARTEADLRALGLRFPARGIPSL